MDVGLTQVTFRFGSEFDVRYLEDLPKRGDRMARGGRNWIVTSVEPDPTGVVATSDRPREYVRAARVHARLMRDRSLRQRELSASQREAHEKAVAKLADLRQRMQSR